MKKLLCLGLCFVGLALSAAPHWVTTPLLNGTYLLITNNTTWNYQSASNCWYWNYTYATNVNAGLTNGNIGGFLGPLAVSPVEMIPTVDGSAPANASVTVTLGVVTNYAVPSYMTPVVRNSQNTNYGAVFPSTATNVVTFSFITSGDGVNFDQVSSVSAAGTPLKVFTFSLVYSNAVTTVTTNLPSAFTAGSRKVMVKTIAADNTSGSVGVVIDSLGISQLAQ